MGATKRDSDAAALPLAQPKEAPKAPRIDHCFKPGDLVEAMYCEGCWVSGRVLATRKRQLLVQYEKESADLEANEISGPRHVCVENETPKDVSRKTGVPASVLLKLNAERFPELVATSKLRAKTTLALPELHVCRENETPKAVAKRYGRDLEQLLEMNAPSVHGLDKNSKLRESTALVLPPLGEGVSAAAAAALPPQLGTFVELEAALVDRRLGSAAAGLAVAASAAASSSSTAAGSGEGAWRLAEVTRLLSGSRFAVVLCPADVSPEESHGVGDGSSSR